MKDVIVISGYDLAAKILESHPNDAIETMLKFSGNGAECDWLEFKASMTPLPDDKDPEELLHWKYVKSLAAIANTRGGAFVIGVDDATHEAVPLSSAEGLEEYYRMMILGKLEKAEKKYSKNNKKYSLKRSITKDLDPRYVLYKGTTVLVFLVKPCRLDDELYYIKEDSDNRSFTILPYRVKGCGEVKELTDYHDIQRYVKGREDVFASTDLSSAWAELDAEQQASKADETLDNAIRAYHAKLEVETRKKLRAFIPLDVEGDEPDEEDEEEFENPQAISVFDEDDDAWLNSNIKAGDTSDKGSTGSEVEDEAGDLDDDDEFEDDERETSKRTIKIGLYELLEQQNRVVLVGEPGAGKTTCLAHFAVQQGKIERPRPHMFAFIALGRWVDGGSVRGLVEKTCGISQAQIDTLLAEKRLHLILDALNECPDRLRPGAMENIRILLQEHPDLPVVLSSRKAEGVKLSGIPVFEVQSMDAERQTLFLERYLHDADAAQKILDSLLKQPGGASIAQNPMLLRMVVDVVRANGDLPTGRASLYRRWLENWYAREEEKAKKAKDVLPSSKEKSIRLLSQMAFAGRAEGYRDIPVVMARHSLGDKDGTFLDRLCQGPLLEIEEGFVHFRHETIQEYLCAEWLLAEPAALNSLPEKNYDTWGMPIAYAAELSLPNKLPDEMSEAVWEMNPWVAALVTVSPSWITDLTIESRPEMLLATAISSNVNLLSEQLRDAFQEEIKQGRLFTRNDPPLSYLIHLTDDSMCIWETFESAYSLNMPFSMENSILDGLSKFKPIRKINFRSIRSKVRNMFLLSPEVMPSRVLRYFPDVQLGDVLLSWAGWFSQKIEACRLDAFIVLAKRFPSFVPLPIEVLSQVFATGSGGGRNRQNDLQRIFGKDYVQKVLSAICLKPRFWIGAGVVHFLKFAKKNKNSVHEAVRTLVVNCIQLLEGVDVSPDPYLQGIRRLCDLLDDSDVPILLPQLSLFGKLMLKKVGLNPQGFCTCFYERLPLFEMEVFLREDLRQEDRRREIVMALLNQDAGFIMSIDDIKFRDQDRNFEIGFCSKTFPEGVSWIRSVNKALRPDHLTHSVLSLGSNWKVHVLLTKVHKRFKFVVDHATPILGNERHVAPCESTDSDVDTPKSLEGSVLEGLVYRKSDLTNEVVRYLIKQELKTTMWEMRVLHVSENRSYLFFSHPSFPDNVYCPARYFKCQDKFEVGQIWNVKVAITKNKKDEAFGFIAQSVKPIEICIDVHAQCKENEQVNAIGKHKSKSSSVPFVAPIITSLSSSTIVESVNDRMSPVPSPKNGGANVVFRKTDLKDETLRQQIVSELSEARFEMVVLFISEDRNYLFFSHPSFPDNVYCLTRSAARSKKYQDVFEVGQTWSIKVRVSKNKKDGTWDFIARNVKPTKQNPVCYQDGRDLGDLLASKPDLSHSSHLSIYIDETWPGTQDHAYENVGVIGGIVVPWEGVDEKRLPVVKTHLDNGSAARNAIQTMLGQPEVFPFVFPIKWDHAVGAGGRQYFELVQHALMLLLGWMLPQRVQPTTVDIFLEHISGYMDGHDETEFISSLTQAMRLLSGGRRFANWQIRRVEWVDKEFGYVPYGDLVCKTCVPREEQQLLAHEVRVREWEGFLPFSKDAFPLLRDMDTASPSGLADLLISFAKVAEDTPFFRRVRKIAIDRAQSDVTFRDAVISRFEECYAQPQRDMVLLNRVVPHFLKEFPPDLFKERPRMQLLRILIGFQHANHNGDPDLASALVEQYHSLRPRILELDRDLCAYADLNLAVHHHDSFEFDTALSLVNGWINDPLFPALSVMNRGRMFSSRGQSLALLGRNQEADGAFGRALSVFSAEPELLAQDIAQTKTYRAMNALDHDAPSAVPLVESLLGQSLIAAALDFTHVLDTPFVAHLFLKTLWRMRPERSVVLDTLIKNLPADIAVRKQHPCELILFYLALLTKDANPSYAQACAREVEQFFEAIEFGGTLGLVHTYLRVLLKRHGFDAVAEKDFFDELDIVMHYLPKARALIDTLRAGWTDVAISVEGILPFNYC